MKFHEILRLEVMGYDGISIYLSIYIYISGVGGFNPSEKILVSWGYYSQLNGTS